ncbi:MAG: histidine kinase, partial [Anaerolineae bacterium]
MDDELRRLRRVKWGALGLAALFLAAIEAYYYFIRGVPLVDNLVDWLIGMVGAAVLIEITFRAVEKLQRRLQREITERKQAEEDLRKHREHLQELVEARTAELTKANEALQREIAERKRVFEQVQAGRERLAWLTQQVVSAQEEERQRLSRELHDEAGQALTALKISLELIQSDLPAEAGSLRQRLGEAVALTETTMEQIRLQAHGLRPPALD